MEQLRAFYRSGNKPDDIPSHPEKIYKGLYKGPTDWIGPTYVDRRRRNFLPYKEARTIVHSFGLKNLPEWIAFTKSDRFRSEFTGILPAAPNEHYGDEFPGYGDWIGTGNLAPKDRDRRRSLADTVIYLRSLKLHSQEDWRRWCAAGRRPGDVPGDPIKFYGPAFIWEACLSPANYIRPLPDALTFVHSLELETRDEWYAFYDSGKVPHDIPRDFVKEYGDAVPDIAFWLGVTKWTRKRLQELLQSLRSHAGSLDENELYTILHAEGALPPLRLLMKASSALQVIRDLKGNDGQKLEKALAEASPSLLAEMENAGEFGDFNDDGLDDLLTKDDRAKPTALCRADGSAGTSATEDFRDFHKLDALAASPLGLPRKIAEQLVSHRVYGLWDRYAREGKRLLDDLRAAAGGRYFAEARKQFIDEVDQVENMPIPPGWAFSTDGIPRQPNVMQRRTAWSVLRQRRIGNWSEPGTGKMLAAILASRIIDARVTCIVTNHATVDAWANHIRRAYPDSVVSTSLEDAAIRNGDGHNYIILNYEKFQTKLRHPRVRRLLGEGLDFLVYDEVQFVKQRGNIPSHRRDALETLVMEAGQQNPELAVLVMSATPVINNLQEGKKLLELIRGAEIPEIDTRVTVTNALAVHRELRRHGIRHRAELRQELRVRTVQGTRNDLLRALVSQGHSPLAFEQILLPAKMELMRPHISVGTVIYTHYVEGIVAPLQEYVERLGFTVGLYTGEEKTGLEEFRQKRADVLIGSRPLNTGVDGLQRVSNRLVIACLPWTGAEYEQVVGRLYRQGCSFSEVEVLIPQVMLGDQDNTWSFDRDRLQAIVTKRTLADCAVDGVIPAVARVDEAQLYKRSRQVLDRLIASVHASTPVPPPRRA